MAISINRRFRPAFCLYSATQRKLSASILICLITSAFILCKLVTPIYWMIAYSDYSIYADSRPVCSPSKKASPILSSEPICYNPNNRTILFIQFTDWNDLDACAVTTAAVHNPRYGVCVLQADDIYLSKWYLAKWKKLGNVQITPLDPGKVLQGTTLMDWYKCACSNAADRKYIMAEASDALRIAYMYRYGGVYLDTDVLTLKSFDGLVNTMSWLKEPIMLNGAVLIFNRGHDFIAEVIGTFPRYVKANQWGTSGPFLLTHVYQERRKRFGHKDAESGIMTVMPSFAFYPFIWYDGQQPFKAAYYDLMTRVCKHSYTIHLYRTQFTIYWKGEKWPQLGSFVAEILNKVCYDA